MHPTSPFVNLAALAFLKPLTLRRSRSLPGMAVALILLATLPSTSAQPVEDETSRLLQVYMQKRAELVEIRRAGREAVAKEKNETAQHAALAQLQRDEGAARAAAAQAGLRYKEKRDEKRPPLPEKAPPR